MPEILSTNLKSDLNRLFLEQSRASEDYYLFVSSIGPFDPSDSLFSKNEFLEKTLFAKKISSNDMHYMIKYYPWQKGLVFEEYDDQIDLTGVKFYAVVGPNDNDTGDYRVYKCLNNNDRTEVSNPPNWAETTPNQIYETADGYVWKFMYKLTDLQFEAYNAVGYIPLVDDYVIDPPTSTGSQVSDILVVNPNDNFGYKEERGALVGSPYSNGIIIVDPSMQIHPKAFVIVDFKDELYFRQYIEEDNKKILRCLNSEYKDIELGNIFKVRGCIVQQKQRKQKSLHYYLPNKITGEIEFNVNGKVKPPNS